MKTTQEHIYTTVGQLKNAWGSGPDEWGLTGQVELEEDEQIRFSRRDQGYVIERQGDDDDWQAISDQRFSGDDIDAVANSA